MDQIESPLNNGSNPCAILVREGQRQLQQTLLREAEASFRQALKIEPENADALMGLGNTLFLLDRPKESIELLEKACQIKPTPSLQNNCGVVYKALGNLPKAIKYFEKAIARKQNYFDAYYNLGTCLIQQGRPEKALTYFKLATIYAPERAEGWINLAKSALDNQEVGLAEEAYRKAGELLPDYALIPLALGNLLAATGRIAEAAARYEQAIALQPDLADAYYNLANARRDLGDPAGAESALMQGLAALPRSEELMLALANHLSWNGRDEEADIWYQKVIAADAGFPNAQLYRAACLRNLRRYDEALNAANEAVRQQPENLTALNMLGTVLCDLQRWDVAENVFTHALKLDPGFADGYFNLGNASYYQDNPAGAIFCYEKTLECNPDLLDAVSNLSAALEKLQHANERNDIFQSAMEAAGRTLDAMHRRYPRNPEVLTGLGDLRFYQLRRPEAIALYREALTLDEARIKTHINLGKALEATGELDPAIIHYERAVALHPGLADARYALACALLPAGRLREGWEYYEARFEVASHPVRPRPFPQPRWQGKGGRVLVWGEQGLGDEVLFASVVPDALEQAEHCLLECEPRLAPLFARSFPKATVIGRQEPPHPRLTQEGTEFQIPAGSLPRLFRQEINAFPRHPYLLADPQKRQASQAFLSSLTGKKVGLCWRSMLRFVSRQGNYTALGDWQDVLRQTGISLVNLQYDDCEEELAWARQTLGVTLHVMPELDLKNDLDGAAALIAELDLVISPSTVIAHLAGALGVKTWIPCSFMGWTRLGTDTFPWYPDVRAFVRQPGEDWSTTVAAIAGALSRWVGTAHLRNL